MKILAIDMGASSGRGILGELAGGKIAFSEIYRFKNEPVERDGHKFWDIHRLHAETVKCLQLAGNDVESVGIDTWGVDYGYVAPSGEVIGLPFAYRDLRTVPMMDFVSRLFGGDRLYGINGLQAINFNTIYQVADDVKSRPGIVNSAARIQLMPDLLGYLITGKLTAEYSIASTTGLLDAQKREWSDEVIGALGLPRRLFGPISMPGEFSAPLKPEITRATGSRARFVLAAGHDTADAVAATPLVDEDSAYISSGTWSLVGMEIAQPVLTPLAREYNFTNEGGVNGTIRLLKNVMGLWLVQELQRVWMSRGQSLDFEAIQQKASSAPAFVSLISPNTNRFYAPVDMEHEIAEECRRTGQPVPDGVGPMARCVFESLALEYRRCVERLEKLTGRTIKRVHIVGGGVQNKLLCQMTADACGVPVLTGPVEATALGNIMVQAVALGQIKNVIDGRRIVRENFQLDEYKPRATETWDRAYKVFELL